MSVTGVFLFFWIVGFPMFLLGVIVGTIKERIVKKALGPQPVKPVCPCTHLWGEHKEGKQCQARIKRPVYSGGVWMGNDWVLCSCTKYHGPNVINEEFFLPDTVYPPLSSDGQ